MNFIENASTNYDDETLISVTGCLTIKLLPQELKDVQEEIKKLKEEREENKKLKEENEKYQEFYNSIIDKLSGPDDDEYFFEGPDHVVDVVGEVVNDRDTLIEMVRQFLAEVKSSDNKEEAGLCDECQAEAEAEVKASDNK